MDDFARRPDRPKIELDSNPATDDTIQPVHASLPVVIETITEEQGRSLADETGSVPTKSPGKKKFNFKIPTPKTKKQWIIAIAIMVILLGGAGTAIYYFILRDTSPPPITNSEPQPEPGEPAPTTVASVTSGRQIEPAINERPIYAVQIENSPEARPQSGLREADIVSEAVAEGGITRFNAIFHDNIPANIGPVRSLRPYYIDWFLPYDAAIIHAGGSPEALRDARKLSLKDLDSVGAIMRRISSRYSPHNYYTTGQQVLNLMDERNYSSKVTGSLPRKEAAPAETVLAGTINIKISSALYNVSYSYDKEKNRYFRSQGGSGHADAESGKQLAPDVVIVPILSKGIHKDGVHTQYTAMGSGKVFVFQDGIAVEGTWTKPDRNKQWQLKDKDGNEIKLNPGQTWFTITDAAGNVSYQP